MLQFAMRERIINYYWKLRRYYWKYKFAIRKAMIITFEFILSAKLPYWKARKAYDIGRLFLIRLFWKLKGALNYVGGYSGGYIRHFAVIGYWKARKAYDIGRLFMIRLFWKLKGALNFVGGYSLSAKLPYWKARKAYDLGRLFLIRLFWRLKGALNYVGGYSVGYIRHFVVIGYWKLRRLINRMDEARHRNFFHPIKKAYWFLSYQVQKRIFPIFRKKNRND